MGCCSFTTFAAVFAGLDGFVDEALGGADRFVVESDTGFLIFDTYSLLVCSGTDFRYLVSETCSSNFVTLHDESRAIILSRLKLR